MTQKDVSKKVLDILSNQLVIKEKDSMKRIKSLISRSNPYMLVEFDNDIDFLLKVIETYLGKSWSTYHGNLLEYIQCSLSGGVKSDEVGMDIDLQNNTYAGAKSSSSWANADQRKTMERNSKRLKEKKQAKVFVTCAYGKGKKEYESYTQLAGQEAWEFLTGDEDMYYKVLNALEEHKSEVIKLKESVYGDLTNDAIEFWKKNFYTNHKFDKKKYIDYVSKKREVRKQNKSKLI
jgi:hypothetical protein